MYRKKKLNMNDSNFYFSKIKTLININNNNTLS